MIESSIILLKLLIILLIFLLFNSLIFFSLIITNGGLNNAVDIYLEGMFNYIQEEEVLFLLFCLFTIKVFY